MSDLSKQMRKLIDRLERKYAYKGKKPVIIYKIIRTKKGFDCIIEVDRKWVDDASVMVFQNAEYALAEMRRIMLRNDWVENDDGSDRNYLYGSRVRYRFNCPEKLRNIYKKI